MEKREVGDCGRQRRFGAFDPFALAGGQNVGKPLASGISPLLRAIDLDESGLDHNLRFLRVSCFSRRRWRGLFLRAQLRCGRESEREHDGKNTTRHGPKRKRTAIALLVGWFVGTFGGSWLAMRISRGDGAGWIVAGAVIGAGVYRALTLADTWWMIALGVVIPIVAAWAAQRAAASAPAAPTA